MEEDIKILEEMKKDIIYDSDEDYDNQVAIRQIKAIENLINRVKELEECLEVTSKALNNVAYDQMPIAIQDLMISSIHKSKIREKIEKINKREEKIMSEKNAFGFAEIFILNNMRITLQEILEDK